MIRPARPSDLAALYAICLRTGDAGADATDRYDDPDLLGHVYAGPYLALEPDLALVATGPDDDEPAGYCLAALDTRVFEQRCAQLWWPPLRRRYPRTANTRDSDARLVELIHAPPRTVLETLADHPSHLHIDLLPSLQGRGVGAALIERQLAALADAGSPGVHLGVDPRNRRAIAFYRRLGFAESGPESGPGEALLVRSLGGSRAGTRSR